MAEPLLSGKRGDQNCHKSLDWCQGPGSDMGPMCMWVGVHTHPSDPKVISQQRLCYGCSRGRYCWDLGPLKDTEMVCLESPGLNLPSAVVHCCSQDFPKTWSTLSPWRTTSTPLLAMVAWSGSNGTQLLIRLTLQNLPAIA